LAAIRTFVTDEHLEQSVSVHEAMCMSGCAVGPRVDLCMGSRRVRYFQRQKPPGREDLLMWASGASVEEAMLSYVTTEQEVRTPESKTRSDHD